MFDPALFAAFVVAASILTITPGVDSAMVLRTAADSPRSAIYAGLGIALGCFIWGTAVALGLGALLQVSELAYTIVKWLGAAYLCWLGCKLFFTPRSTLALDVKTVQKSGITAFSKGLLTNLLNPKIGVFYVTFLPQFIPPDANIIVHTILLVSVHLVLTAIWFTGLILATVPLGNLLRKPVVVNILDRLTGLVFIGFGLKLATSKA